MVTLDAKTYSCMDVQIKELIDLKREYFLFSSIRTPTYFTSTIAILPYKNKKRALAV